MSSNAQVPVLDPRTQGAGVMADHTITLVYDSATQKVTFPDLPVTINVNKTVTFVSPDGIAEVTFISPFGDPMVTMRTGDIKRFTVGGIYQFSCSVNGNAGANGSGIEIIPHR